MLEICTVMTRATCESKKHITEQLLGLYIT